MSIDPGLSASLAASAELEIAQLEVLISAARSRLAALNQEVDDARNRFPDGPTVRLVEANEQLVLAAMRYQADADAAAQALEQVSRTARLDPLTGLPNRSVLLDRLAHAIPNAKRREATLALLFLDLNNFKHINDTLGHAVGDGVLKQVAGRLAAAVREVDTVARLGGDEFVCLLTEVVHASDAARVAEKLVQALTVPMFLDEHVLRLTASIGISLFPSDGVDAASLLEHADSAMYRAKRHGLRSVVFHGEASDPDRQSNPPAPAAGEPPATRIDLALAEHERANVVLREANEQLVIAALNAQELHSAAQAAQERQARFLAHTARELRDPLGALRHAIAVLAKQNARAAPRVHALIERQVDHLGRLIDDLIDASRAGTRKFRSRPERADVDEPDDP